MRSIQGDLASAIARAEEEAREVNDGRDRIDHIAAALLADDGFVTRLLNEHAAGWASGVSHEHAARAAWDEGARAGMVAAGWSTAILAANPYRPAGEVSDA